MIISVNDSNAVHGISIFDEDGRPIRSIQSFDTETFVCLLPEEQFTVAAGFIISCYSTVDLHRYIKSFPQVLQNFICYHDPDDEGTPAKFIADQLKRRTKLRSFLLKDEDPALVG